MGILSRRVMSSRARHLWHEAPLAPYSYGSISHEEPPASLETHAIYRLGLAYGRQIYPFRWYIIALWVVALLVSLPFASKISSVLTGGGYSFSGSESVQVETIAIDKLHQPPSQAEVVFHSANTPVSDPTYQSQVNDFISQARGFPNVASVNPGSVGLDGRTTFVVVNFTKDADAMQQQFGDFRARVASTASAGPAQIYITGNLAVYDEFNQIALQDTEHADVTALPIALVVLLIIFGTLIAAVMPLRAAWRRPAASSPTLRCSLSSLREPSPSPR